MSRYLVLAAEPWAQRIALNLGDGFVCAREEHDLTWASWNHVDAAFVLHWHWLIPPTYLARCPFIGFHASDLPHFRGGAPIENQQKRGITETKLTAFRLTEHLDAGPILLQEPLSLAGTKADVLARIAALVPGMMARIIAGDYREREQGDGSPIPYRRKDAEWQWSLRLQDCPCCDLIDAYTGTDAETEWQICLRCGWENDLLQRDRPTRSLLGANDEALHEARRRWKDAEDAR
jgi:hypothetical protein